MSTTWNCIAALLFAMATSTLSGCGGDVADSEKQEPVAHSTKQETSSLDDSSSKKQAVVDETPTKLGAAHILMAQYGFQGGHYKASHNTLHVGWNCYAGHSMLRRNSANVVNTPESILSHSDYA